jgi:CubicO group peptidase (beta-lactamase class C family)
MMWRDFLFLGWFSFVFQKFSLARESCEENNSISCQLLTEILLNGVNSQVYPGAVAIVGDQNGILFETSVGSYSYQPSPAVTMDSIFDLASLTKVISTTSALALLYQQGHLSLKDPITKYLGEEFSNQGKDLIEIQHCLLHNAGFAPDPVPWYWEEEFHCPNTEDLPVPLEDFSCLDSLIYPSLLNETLQSQPGEVYVYSDLSFITLQMVIGVTVLRERLIVRERDYSKECLEWFQRRNGDREREGQQAVSAVDRVCAYEAFVRKEVFNFDYLETLPTSAPKTVTHRSPPPLPP